MDGLLLVLVAGEAGAGKTALLDYLAGRAAGCWVLRVSGVQWEMELAFAGVHLLDGLTLLVTDGPAAAVAVLRQATSAFAGPDVRVTDQLRWSWMAPMMGDSLWDYQGFSLSNGRSSSPAR